MSDVIRILYLSDNPSDSEMIRSVLAEDGLECQITQVATRIEFQTTLLQQNIDLILCDDYLVIFNCFTALSIAQDRCPDTPFILLVNTLSEDAIIDALRRGATECLSKQRLARLPSSVRRAMRESAERVARRYAETSLRFAERRFMQAFNAIPVALLIITMRDGDTLAVNDYFLAVTGYTRDEVIGRPMHKLGVWASLADRSLLIGRFQNLSSTYSCEVGCRTKNGDVRKLLVSAEAIEFEGRSCLLIAGNDVTELHQEEVRGSKKRSSQGSTRFDQAFHTNLRPMFITRLSDGRYVDANDAWLHLSGYSRDELVGRASVELKMWAKPADRSSFIEGLRNKGSVREFEYIIRRKSGELTVGVISAELIDLNGEPCALLIDQEVSERKRLEDRLRQAQRVVNLCFFQD